MNRALAKKFEAYRGEYARLWADMKIRDAYVSTVRESAARILENKARYQAVEISTGVPWYIIGLIHKMEGNLSFQKHLHNGDTLQARTWRVPAGRPRTGTPPFTWEESATDALHYDGLTKVKGWSVEIAAFYLEKFNGFGYHGRGIPSPYLWSYSHAYTKGKFETDGVYNSGLISKQSGAMVLLKVLMSMDASIDIELSEAPVEITPDETEILPPAKTKPLTESRTMWASMLALISGWLIWAAQTLQAAITLSIELLSQGIDVGGTVTAPLLAAANMVGANLPWIGLVGLIAGCFLAAYARYDDRKTGKN